MNHCKELHAIGKHLLQAHVTCGLACSRETGLPVVVFEVMSWKTRVAAAGITLKIENLRTVPEIQ